VVPKFKSSADGFSVGGADGWEEEEREGVMLLLLAIVLAIAWVAGFAVFHVASAAIHVLVILAVVSLAVHFLRGGSRKELT
jgi:hypothetical protein